MVRSRRQGREAALRALYEMEVGKKRVGEAIRDMVEHSDLPSELNQFATELVQQVHDNLDFIDDRLARIIQDWDFERIPPIDKNLLRMGACELYYFDNIPPKATINEAVVLAKRYSTAESGKFVNGVLGNLMHDSPKANWNPELNVPEAEEPAPVEDEPAEEEIEADTPEAKELSKVGLWKIRTDDVN